MKQKLVSVLRPCSRFLRRASRRATIRGDDEHHDEDDSARTGRARDDGRRSLGATAHVLQCARYVVGRSVTDSAGTATTFDARGNVIGRESIDSAGTRTLYDARGRSVGIALAKLSEA
jgi:YD repeat-containing protein